MTLHPLQLRAFLALASILVLLAACQTPQRTAAPVSSVAPPPVAQPQAIPFPVWLDGARREALSRGVSQATVAAALDGLTPDPAVIDLDTKQPEYSQTFGRYLANAVSEARVAKGRELMRQNAGLLAAIERRYGVPGRYLVAFWGIETDFGRNTGSFSTVRSLATLAYDSRRGPYFRDEMFAALTILDEGDIDNRRMTGSWAGAMGQTQFMPSAYLKYAVDQDGDGRKDIWTSVPDALGSVANYLKTLGWDGTRGWGQEVSLPSRFDASLASLDGDAAETVKTMAEWRALGIGRADGSPLADTGETAALVLPGGINGPAFLVANDYRVILKYNRSTFYAVAVGYLADRLGGAGPLVAQPQPGEPLRRDDIIALQQGLSSLGLLPGTPDGIAGTGTRKAVRAFQKANGLPPDGYIDAALIAAVRAKGGGA
jgi:membrane-bound lytic murein transglycosylase B